MDIALLTLLHLLIPVYWLGGDLGAFYGSGFMIDPKRTVPERMMALTILNNIDMAPRTALILALPTGVALGWAKGWLALSFTAVSAIWIGGLVWLALAWTVHLRHGQDVKRVRAVDLAIRYVVLLALVGGAVAGLSGSIQLPFFIAVKMLLLAACVGLGLIIRRQLVPLFPPIAAMRTQGPSPEGDRAIAGVIAQTRPMVLLIWLLVLAASLLGIATPV